MNERMCESLSAVMDGQANELELARVLAEVVKDDELRRRWMRYNLAAQVVKGQQLAYLDRDISAGVRSALEVAQVDGPRTVLSKFKQNMLRPMISLGVAATVAATVVFGGQQLAQLGNADRYGVDRSVATSASPVGMLNSLGATTVQASYGTQAVPVLRPATRTAYQQLAQQRLRRYMQEHAEHAALNSPQGLVPFARVPQIRE